MCASFHYFLFWYYYAKSHLLSLYRRHDLPRVLACPELKVPDPLPCPRVQFPICDRNRDTRTNQCRLDMCLERRLLAIIDNLVDPFESPPRPIAGCTYRHVIQPLGTMSIQISLPILGCDPVQRIAHIGPHILVPVLVE
jgi:hypothetical protein